MQVPRKETNKARGINKQFAQVKALHDTVKSDTGVNVSQTKIPFNFVPEATRSIQSPAKYVHSDSDPGSLPDLGDLLATTP